MHTPGIRYQIEAIRPHHLIDRRGSARSRRPSEEMRLAEGRNRVAHAARAGTTPDARARAADEDFNTRVVENHANAMGHDAHGQTTKGDQA